MSAPLSNERLSRMKSPLFLGSACLGIVSKFKIIQLNCRTPFIANTFLKFLNYFYIFLFFVFISVLTSFQCLLEVAPFRKLNMRPAPIQVNMTSILCVDDEGNYLIDNVTFSGTIL